MRNVLIMLCFICSANFAAAQSVSGKVIDSTSSEPLNMATVSVYKTSDTSLIAYRLTNAAGEFKIPGIPAAGCYVVVSYSGYSIYRAELEPVHANAELGTIRLVPTAQDLDEVLVVAERPPVVIKKDTIEFNANAFKTLPNAVVEDLLKKLPGVQVDRDGNITVAGKRVNKITVDGKNFFGSDPKMASRNLPASTIDKVQVSDDLEELNARDDDNRSQVGKVINLTFKRGYKKGIFGKMYAGAGTEGRYEAGAIANAFRDTLQLSLVGYTNNLNRPGFTGSDLLQTGGLSRNSSLTGNRSMSMNNGPAGSSISINGINFGGLSDYGGISASSGAGFNLNHAPDLKRAFYLQYFYGYVDTDVKERVDSRTNFGDSTLNKLSATKTNIYSSTHIANAGIVLKPDSLTTFKGAASYTNGSQLNLFNTGQRAYLNELFLNEGSVINRKQNRNGSSSLGAEYTRLSKAKKGRKFSLNADAEYNSRRNNYKTLADINFHYPNVYDSISQQLRLEDVPQLNVTAGAAYSEPLSKALTLRTNAKYDYEKLKNDIRTEDLITAAQLPDLSNGFERVTQKGGISSGIEWKIKEWKITPRMRLQHQQFNTEYTLLYQPLHQQQTSVLPQLDVQYKQLNINYNRDIVLPDYKYFIAVSDNTNPYMIRSGNTALLPTTSDNIYAYYNNYDTKRNLNIWSWMDVTFLKNDVIQSVTLNENGIQVISPVNADGTKKIRANYGITKEYKHKQSFTWFWNFGGYTQYTNSLFLYNGIGSRQKSLQNNNWGILNFNWADKFEWNANFGFSVRSTTNSNSYFKKFTSTRQSWGVELVDRHIKHLILETQLNYNFNSQIEDPAFQKYLLWKASINYTMLKDERGVLKLSVFDILNQMHDADITTTQNQVVYSFSNVLPRYAMLSFTYNIFAAGAKKKVGGQWNLW